ncbi:hypothetical protein DFP93_12732 [Aneurinibacillus soli]|uniref:Uncharacterized protein n=1 Tax=Aneurinibacillus soli TaxID=1500254 RepID=A0A0U5AST9_9BACL|nr:hypothetical protein [Aneurinibacillus soli]PYE57925.1 hypothetical protein DFP93_12732 [Aneurinibacillus soli]BAU26890.1 hypothetical protein CB4_01059 [Aneurinibacillus soli]
MRHASVQVRALLTEDERGRYEKLFEVGKFLESQNRHDLAYTIQRELETLIEPAIERLQEKGKQRGNRDYLDPIVSRAHNNEEQL